MIVFHIDMDSYFASVEQQARPWLRGKPVVVSGRPDIHSVVAAASKEAKRYGIKAGMSTWEAKKLCPQVIFVPGDPDKYESMTRRFLTILIAYTPMVEVYSIDEVFLDASQIVARYPDPVALAKEIKARFREELGAWITCTIGIAPNKLLAKLATEQAKPDGIRWIRPEQVPDLLQRTPVDAVTGIGPRIAKRLSYMGVWTLVDLGKIPEPYLRRVFGVYGTVLHLWGKGLDPTPLKPYWQEEDEKSIGHSHALPKPLRHPEGARRVLHYLALKTARRMRQKGFVGRVVFALYRDEELGYHGAQRALSVPTCDEREIYATALAIVDEKLGGFPEGVTLVGVRVGGLQNLKGFPRPLFPGDNKREKLLFALDKIRDRFGEEAIVPASTLACRLLVGATGGMGREKELSSELRTRG